MIKTVTENTKKKKTKKSGTSKDKTVIVHKPSSSDRVVKEIIDNLLSGRYVPGQKLIEADLVKAFSLSRGPIREALKRLASEGVVRLSPHRGAFIRAITKQELGELMVVLEYLVGLMAKLAANAVKQGIDPTPIREAYELLGPYRDPNSKDRTYIEQRRNFYEVLGLVGNNKQLTRIMPIVDIHIIRAQFIPFMTSKELEARSEEYAAITNAVLDGNPKRAEQEARKHISETGKRFFKLPDAAFASEE